MGRIWDLSQIPKLEEGQYLDFQVEERCGDVIAVGGNLSPGLLLSAYRQGLFPWYNAGEDICWWCPRQRFVLIPQNLHLPKSLIKVMRRSIWRPADGAAPRAAEGQLQVTLDQAFADVIVACAETRRSAQARQDGPAATWITPEMQYAYINLHMRGYAHSVESWQLQPDGSRDLVGGLYGVGLGRCFYGESMFSRQADASKVAFAVWALFLQDRGFALIDCQQETPHLRRFGAQLRPRSQFLQLLAACEPASELRQRVARREFWRHCRGQFPHSGGLQELLRR